MAIKWQQIISIMKVTVQKKDVSNIKANFKIEPTLSPTEKG